MTLLIVGGDSSRSPVRRAQPQTLEFFTAVLLSSQQRIYAFRLDYPLTPLRTSF